MPETKIPRVSKPPRPSGARPSSARTARAPLPPPKDATPPILRFLTGGAHLQEPQRSIFARFEILAHEMVSRLPPGPELSAGLRKLLEAKDCFVRASFE